MSKIKIAFQGEMGAYSHIACEELFPGSVIKACPTFEETFKIAHEDENYKIIIPIDIFYENKKQPNNVYIPDTGIKTYKGR